MEDLLGKMQEILSSKEGQEQLKSFAQMMGVSDSLPDLSNIGNMLGGTDNTSNTTSSNDSPSQNQSNIQTTNQANNSNNNDNSSLNIGDALSGIDINMLMQVQKVLSNLKNEDADTKLLLALKPHFRPERQNKIDKAVKILQLLSVLPLIKESGLLGGLFSDGK